MNEFSPYAPIAQIAMGLGHNNVTTMSASSNTGPGQAHQSDLIKAHLGDQLITMRLVILIISAIEDCRTKRSLYGNQWVAIQ